MIKEFFTKVWEWIVDRWKKFWKWILVGTVVTASTLTMLPQPIPAEFITAPENNTYKIGVMNYTADLEKNILAERPLQYRLDDKFISFKPIEMRWDNSSFKTIQSKNAIINEKNYLYKDAFGKGIDIDMNFGDRVFEKITKVNSLEDLGKIPKNAEFLEVVFEVETNFIIDGWNKHDKFEITDTVRLGDFSYIEPAMAWDSYSEEVCSMVQNDNFCDVGCSQEQEANDECEYCDPPEEVCYIDTNRIKIRTVLRQGGGNLYLVKYLPIDWLKSAQFPIYTDLDITYGTASPFNEASTGFIRTAELDTNKFVVCYTDIGDTYDGSCRVATVSGDTFTWDGESDFSTSDIYEGTWSTLGVCKLNTDKFAVAYQDDAAADDGFTRAVTVTTRTIGDWGSEQEFETGDAEYIDCVGTNVDAYTICYNDETDTDTGKCVANTVSGVEIILGTPLEFDAGTPTDYYPSSNHMTKLDTNKFVNCFSYNDSGYTGECVAGTVSTRTITFGGVTQFVNSDTEKYGYAYMGVTSPDTDKFIVSYIDDGSSDDGYSVAGTVSTRTITFGTPACHLCTASTLRIEQNKNVYTDSTHFVVGFVDMDETPDFGQSNYCTTDWSDRSISCSTPEPFEGGKTGGAFYTGLDLSLISSNKIVICFRDDDDSGYGKCIIGDTPAVEEGTNMQINIGDSWKEIDSMKINIGDVWKDVSNVWINIGDVWKEVY